MIVWKPVGRTEPVANLVARERPVRALGRKLRTFVWQGGSGIDFIGRAGRSPDGCGIESARSRAGSNRLSATIVFGLTVTPTQATPCSMKCSYDSAHMMGRSTGEDGLKASTIARTVERFVGSRTTHQDPRRVSALREYGWLQARALGPVENTGHSADQILLLHMAVFGQVERSDLMCGCEKRIRRLRYMSPPDAVEPVDDTIKRRYSRNSGTLRERLLFRQPDEFADTVRELPNVCTVPRDERAGHPNGIPEEEPLVEHLS